MSSTDSSPISTPNSTPIETPESSVYVPTEMSSSSSDLSFSQSSFVQYPPTTISAMSSISDLDDNDSLTSTSLSTDDEAEAEWQESLQQLEHLVTLVVVPFLGKYVGRRCAYWAWAKFMTRKYPVNVVITNSAAFKTVGGISPLSSPSVPF